MRRFILSGHNVYVTSPIERCFKGQTNLTKLGSFNILKVRTLNIQKTSIIEKTLSFLLIERLFRKAVMKFLSDVKFDMVLYSTPPITFERVIKYVKNRDGAMTYLLLKDIFPQNAVDLRLVPKKSLVHAYFRMKEINLYRLSDFIGCMSPANVEYLLNNNPFISPAQVEVNPNSIEPFSLNITENQKLDLRRRYGIPLNSIAFINGGNFGKPQGIPYLLNILNSQINRQEVFFIIVGSGTEFAKIKLWQNLTKPNNVLILSGLPRDEFNSLVHCSDVGLIFLDYKFTIPNFPSRLLTYLNASKPIIAATDEVSDLGSTIEEYKCGFWVPSNDLDKFKEKIEIILSDPDCLIKMGKNANYLLLNEFDVGLSYNTILNHVNRLTGGEEDPK